MFQPPLAPSLAERLAAHKPDLHWLATLVIGEPQLIPSLFDTITSAPSACAKFGAAKLLQVLSEESPATLYRRKVVPSQTAGVLTQTLAPKGLCIR